jgi:hypothetical protein
MAAALPVGTSQAEMDEIWTRVSTAAEAAKQNYIATHWPQYAVLNLPDYLALQAPPIANGASVAVVQLNGTAAAGSPGTATVTNGVLVNIHLTV